MTKSNEMPRQLQLLSRAIDEVLTADHGQRNWLRNTVPLDVAYADAVRHYGGPGVGLDLWCMCSAIEKLRNVWLGSSFPLADDALATPPAPEPDPATAEQPPVEEGTTDDKA